MTRLIRRPTWVVLWCSLVMAMPQETLAGKLASRGRQARVKTAYQGPTVADVALRNGGQLVGQVLSNAGRPLPGESVTIRWQGRQLGETVTDNNGLFTVAGLRGGTCTIAAAGTTTALRLWAPGTAPPSAGHAAMVVAGGPVVRGQNGCQPAYAGGRVGYTRLGALLRNPWVLGALVGTAIAVPIATADDGNDSAS